MHISLASLLFTTRLPLRRRPPAPQVAVAGIIVSYILSGISTLFYVFCYAEFAVEIPYVGGSFSYLCVELGDFIAFITAAKILLEALIGAAGLARSWISYFSALINLDPDAITVIAFVITAGVCPLEDGQFALYFWMLKTRGYQSRVN